MDQPQNIATVIGGLRIAAHSLAAKLGVKVRIGGSQACTDGETIRLPDLPAGSEESALIARGYVDHEAAHIRHTDFSIQVRPWVNLIEDIRIEQQQGEAFPGCAVNLRRLVAHLKEKHHFRGAPLQPLSCLMAWASCQGRSTLLLQPLSEIAGQMEASCRKLFGEAFCAAFAQLIDEIGRCHSTADCAALADRIEALIRNPPEPSFPQEAPNKRQSEPGAGDGADDAGEDPDKDSARSVADRDDTGDENRSGGQEGEDGEDTAGQERNGSSTSRQRQNLRQAAEADAAKAAENLDVGGILRQALTEEHQLAQRKGNLEQIPETHVIPHRTGGPGMLRDAERGLGIDAVRRQTAQLRARLAGLLQSMRRRPSYPRLNGQRIDPRAVHHLACITLGARVFTSRTERVDVNTAVMILGDRSGSMNGPKIRLALQGAFVTAEALDLLPGIACGVGFFPWGQEVAQIKEFDRKIDATRFDLGARGSTPLAQALLWAGMQLSRRKEPRKMVIVMTDGQPDDVGETRTALERLRACGVEIYGIGIQDRSILSWMDTGARVIARSEELPRALVGALQEALLHRAA